MAGNPQTKKVESEALFTLTLLAIFSVAALDAARPFLGTGASLKTRPVLKIVYLSDQLSFVCGKKGKIMISIMMRRYGDQSLLLFIGSLH